MIKTDIIRTEEKLMINFMEKMLNRKYDLNQEILNIETLLKEQHYGEDTANNCISNNFKTWEFNNNYITFQQLKKDMGIYSIIDKAKIDKNCDLNDYIYYAEYICNIIHLAHEPYYICRNVPIIQKHITNVLNQINYETHYLEDKDYTIIIEKDWQVTESAEIIQDKYNLGEQIYLYRHHSMQGKLNEKADILCRLYKHCEDITPILKNYQYTTLVTDITNLSNNLDIRHAPKDKAKKVLNSLTDEELETWYDELFKLCLDAIILADHSEKRKDIKQLSEKLK